MNILRAALLVLSVLSATNAQSPSGFARKYPAVTSYEVRPGVFMTPTVGPNGKVCEMTVEKRHLNGNVLDSDGFLSDQLVEDLIDELAPLSQRGKELTGIDNWFGSVEIAGTLVISRKTYENAVVEIYGNNPPHSPIENQAFVIIWKNSSCKDSQPATKPH